MKWHQWRLVRRDGKYFLRLNRPSSVNEGMPLTGPHAFVFDYVNRVAHTPTPNDFDQKTALDAAYQYYLAVELAHSHSEGPNL